jgi:Carboxypeptidase regulatory-like domain
LFISLRARRARLRFAKPPRNHRSKTRLLVLARLVALGATAMFFAFGDLSLLAQARQAGEATNAAAVLPDAPGLGAARDDAGQNQSSPSAEEGTCTISGTVLDTNNDVVEDARVVLTSRGGAEREVQSGSNGEFSFSTLLPGSYRVTVSGNGMGTYVSLWMAIHAGDMHIVSQVVLPVATTASSVTVFGDKEQIAEEQVQIAVHQRVLGVFPNFYSSYDWHAPPMGRKQKLKLALRSATDPVAFAGAGAIAGYQQYYNIYPDYGGGIEGYAKRYGAAYANDFSARMLSSAIFASVFRQDPRYFYKGTGSVTSRTLYALSSAVIARNDQGKWRPNYADVLGTFAAGALSNLYYPSSSRGLSLTLVNGLVEIAGHAGTSLLREFVLKGMTSHPGGKP